MDTDILVVGSGIAGLFFSLKVPDKYKVTIITKKGRKDASTNFAQGGIAAVFSKDDSFELHVQDTIKTGEGLSNRDRVELMVKEAPRLVNELHDIGVEFTMDEKGNYDLGREAAHSRRRIVHAKDLTGEAIEKALIARILEYKNIEIIEDMVALDLGMLDNKCVGIWVLNTSNSEIEFISARVVLLATGGAGQVYLHTTNPSVSTGDGIAMAKRCGIKVANMEFVQFHPTSFWMEYPVERAFLISEAVRGEGAVLTLKNGKSFMKKYHSMGSLAPRDVVARAIAKELKRTGDKYVYLDLSRIPSQRIRNRFPNIYNTCFSYGIDITKEPIPCVSAAHYLCGGIVVDESGFTGVDRLYAAGETTCVGVHGANRLASNSLLESVVFSERAAYHAISSISGERYRLIDYTTGTEVIPHEKIETMKYTIKKVMWDNLGVIRRIDEMMDAEKKVSSLAKQISLWEKKANPNIEFSNLRNMVLVARLIISCALQRKESRGLHWVEDYPYKNPNYERDTII